MAANYGFHKDFPGIGSFGVSNCKTPLEAQRVVYRMALKSGWEPPHARERWWQMWRPTELPEGLAEALEDIAQEPPPPC